MIHISLKNWTAVTVDQWESPEEIIYISEDWPVSDQSEDWPVSGVARIRADKQVILVVIDEVNSAKISCNISTEL